MRILVVEDETTMAELLRKGLEEERHSVIAAFDGQTALDIAGCTEFDVILLDLMLPGMDGVEVARRLRNGNNHTPVVMLSDGTLTVAHEDTSDKFSPVETITTQRGTRTMALDESNHNVYLVTAEFGPTPAATSDNPRPRPTTVPDTFTLLIYGR
jgi:CheY-like chemotaxis protein